MSKFEMGRLLLPAMLMSTSSVATLAAAQEAGPQLEEIVVTAQKREQRLQDVPVSVTALSADTLAANRLVTVRDLGAIVPNLTVLTSVGGSSLPIYSMRGLYSSSPGLGADKGVALYMDEVYVGSSSGSLFELADIERVEVLRGPQGTLFGRNSTGGAVSFTTPDPTGEFRLTQKLTLGNYEQFRSSTSLNTPQVGAFSANLTYTHSERRGDIRNLGAGTVWDFTPANGGRPTTFTSPKWLGGQNIEAVAGKIAFEPNADLKMVYRFDRTVQDYVSEGVGVLYEQPLNRAIIGAQPNQALMTQISDKRPDAVNNAATIPARSTAYGHSIIATWRINDNFTLKNVAAVRGMTFKSRWHDFAGAGGLINTGAAIFASVLGPALTASTVGAPFQIQAGGSSTGRDKQWSDELQLNFNSTLATITTGLLYYEQTSVRGAYGEEIGLGLARPGAFRVYPGHLVPFAGQPIGTMGRNSEIKMFSRAAYAQGELHITPQIDLIAGARYTQDIKRGIDRSIVSGASQPIFPLYYKADKWTYNIGANYRPTESVLLYGKYSTGYISGGSLAGITYNPETAKSWEAGVKADWLGKTLRTNLSVFDVDYGSLQLTTSGLSLTPPLPGVNLVIVSAGDARARGFEFEGTYLPVSGVTLSTGVGYTDFKFKRLFPTVTVGTSEYLPQNRPKWTVSLSAQYETDDLIEGVNVSARLDGAWRSKYNGTANIITPSATLSAAEVAAYKSAQVVPAHWLVNGRVKVDGFEIGGADASVSLWGRNIFNDKSPSYVTSLVTIISTTYEQARTFGVDLTFEF